MIYKFDILHERLKLNNIAEMNENINKSAVFRSPLLAFLFFFYYIK